MRQRKPVVTQLVERDDHGVQVTFYFRGNWQKMAAEQRSDTLQAMADQLEGIAEQMRNEVQEGLYGSPEYA